MSDNLNEDTRDVSPVTTIDGQPVGSPLQYVDPDTQRLGNTSYRIEGYDAPETAKFLGGVFVPNQVANDRTQEYVDTIARIGGYDKLETKGKDVYGRTIAKQTNSFGESLGDTLTALGIVQPNLNSSDESLQQKATISAASSLFPELAKADPLLRAAREAKEKDIELNGNPIYVPKESFYDEKMYAAYKSSVGHSAINAEIEEINRLEKILKEENLQPETRSKLENKLYESRNRLYIAATVPDIAGNVLIRHSDRSLMNKANDQARTALHRASLDMLKGLGGIAEMAGRGLGWEYLAEKGRDYSYQQKAKSESLADTLSSFRDINTKDTWSTITDTATYTLNLLAGTLPSMALIVGSTAATGVFGLPALAAVGISSIPPSLMYAGQFYADQPDDKKNSSLALYAGFGSGVLDRLGFEGMLPKGNILSTAGREALVTDLIAANKAATREEALKLIEEASKKELVAMSSTAETFAKQQVASKEAAIRGLATIELSSAGEALTETAQTYLEMMAQQGVWDTDIQYERNFYENLMDAAIGGNVMGRAIGIGHGAYGAAQWHSLASGSDAYKKELTAEQQFNSQQVLAAEQGDPTAYRNVLAAANGERNKPRNKGNADLFSLPSLEGAWNGFKSIVTDPFRLTRQLVDTAIPTIVNADGTFKRNLAILKALMGKTGILPGEGYSGFKQRLIGDFSSFTPAELASRLKIDVGSANKLAQSAWQTTWSKGQKLSGKTEQEIELQSWKDDLDLSLQKMRDSANYFNININDLNNPEPIFESPAYDPKTLELNKERVVTELVQSGASRFNSLKAINNLISGNIRDKEAAKIWLSRHGIFNNPNLNDVFESNVFNRIEALKNDVASKVSHELFLGKNGQILANLLQDAWDAGEFDNELQFKDTVKNVKDWYQIENGKYNPLTNYPKIEKVLGWGVTATMLASLGKAMISSQAETAMSVLGTNGDKVVNQLNHYFKEFFSEIRNEFNAGMSHTAASLGINLARKTADVKLLAKLDKLQKEFDDVSNNTTMSAKDRIETLEKLRNEAEGIHKRLFGRSLFERLGYNESGYNTQARFELPNSNMKRAMQVFAAIIGLRAQTDAVRMTSLAFAADTLVSSLQNLRMLPKDKLMLAMQTGMGLTNDQGHSLRMLQEYGMDVLAVIDFMNSLEQMNIDPVKYFSNEDLVNTTHKEGSMHKYIQDNILTAIANLNDGRIVNPQPHNIPKYYHDPRLRLLTVMTRFMAGLHSSVLPRLYNNYIMNGSAGMRYQAFSVIAMALVFGMLGNELKDLLAYGDDNPYIKSNVKKAQRTLYSSGILGQYEKVVDTFMPLYPNKSPSFSKDPANWTYQTIKGASPVLTWADKPVQAMFDLGEGKTPEAAQKLVRAAPFVGSFPIIANEAKKFLKE